MAVEKNMQGTIDRIGGVDAERAKLLKRLEELNGSFQICRAEILKGIPSDEQRHYQAANGARVYVDRDTSNFGGVSRPRFFRVFQPGEME